MNIDDVGGFGNLGASISDLEYPFNDYDILKLKGVARSKLLLVFSGVNYNKEQFHELSSLLGDILTLGVKSGIKSPRGTTHYSDDNGNIVLPGLEKVTAKKDDEGLYVGLPTGISKRLNWHNNETDQPFISTNFVALQSVTGTKGSITQVCQMVERFNDENEEKQNYLKSLNVLWGVIPGDESIMPDVPEDDNLVGQIKLVKELYKDRLLKVKQQPLIHKSPNGKFGIRFTSSQIMDISKETSTGEVKIFDDEYHKSMMGDDYIPSDEWTTLKEYIMKEYVKPEYIYDHVWNDGDIIYMDQVCTMHRRVGVNGKVDGVSINDLEKRILNRIEVEI